MAGVPVLLEGVLWDEANKRGYKVAISGDLSRTDRQIGGGPILPDEKPPGQPPGIWPGPGDPDYPGKPPGGGDGKPPTIWPSPGRPAHPIVIPPPQVPPEYQPPAPPPPGTVTPVPGNWPTSGIVPPEYLVVQYPGVGPVYVTAPPHAEPAS